MIHKIETKSSLVETTMDRLAAAAAAVQRVRECRLLIPIDLSFVAADSNDIEALELMDLALSKDNSAVRVIFYYIIVIRKL